MTSGSSLKSALQRHVSVAIPVTGLLVIFAIISIRQPMAASYGGLNLILAYVMPLVFVSMAQMLIMSIGDIDLGIGQFVSLAMCVSAALMDAHPVWGLAALFGLVLVYAALGGLIHLFAMPAIVATLGGAFIWYGTALTIFPTPGGTVPDWLIGFMRWKPPLVPLPIIIAVVLALMMHWLVMRHWLGVLMRGFGGNARAVERAGGSALLIRMAVYGGAGLLACIGGLLLSGLTTTGDANVGSNYTLQSIAAVIIGGGRFAGGVVLPIGTVIGAMIILLTGTLLSFANISPNWQLSFQGAILILVLSVRRLLEKRNGF